MPCRTASEIKKIPVSLPLWHARGVHDYYDFGTKTVSTSVAAAGVVLPLSATSKLTEQTVKFGVNYKFWAY
jgi:opacity protein-like surface antigen